MGSTVEVAVAGIEVGLAATVVGVGEKRAVTVAVDDGVNESPISSADSELSHAMNRMALIAANSGTSFPPNRLCCAQVDATHARTPVRRS